MSAKSAFLSATPSKFALPPVYAANTVADVAGIASGAGNSTALVVATPPAGRYIVSYSILTTGADLTGYQVDVNSTADAAALDLITGTTMSSYRSNGSVLLICNGLNPVVFTVTCSTSAGTWTLKAGSYVEMVSIC
jgi:hypothetical protein